MAFFPAFIFWILDAFYLWQERLYRKLYDGVRVKEEESIDFSMDISNLNEKPHPWLSATLSKTLIPFHGALIGAIIVVMFVQI